ncbi:MAG: hypothetical protein KDA45_08270 [Planctomycetales bacterium]|nr:hypothetical protein [Planctomycetales bacterium]
MRRLKQQAATYLSLSFLSLAVLAVGCGPKGPNVVPVEGKLTLDGDPLIYKGITFVPTEGTEGNGAAGYSNGKGEYKLKAFVTGVTKDFTGCPPGKYKVVVDEPTLPISAKDFNEDGEVVAPETDDSEVVVAIAPGMGRTRSDIPPIYRNENRTPLVVEVPEEGGTVDLPLKSGGR